MLYRECSVVFKKGEYREYIVGFDKRVQSCLTEDSNTKSVLLGLIKESNSDSVSFLLKKKCNPKSVQLGLT